MSIKDCPYSNIFHQILNRWTNNENIIRRKTNLNSSFNFYLINLKFSFFSLFLLKLLLITSFLLINFNFVESTKLKLCHQIPTLKFYDIATYLDDINNNNNRTNTSSNEHLSNISLNQSSLYENHKYVRTLFDGNMTQTNGNGSHATMIALTSLQDDRANIDQLLLSLENIYHNLVEQKSFKNIRFLLINLNDSYDPEWVLNARKNVSFEVYQDLSDSTIENSLDGSSGDVFVFDRCNLLAYFIRFPLSFIDRKDPFFQATLLAAHSDSPCKEKCPVNQTTPMVSDKSSLNTSSTLSLESITTPIPTSTTSSPTVQPTTEAPNNDTDQLSDVLSQMGEVLQIFYNKYTQTIDNTENNPNKNETDNTETVGETNNTVTTSPSTSKNEELIVNRDAPMVFSSPTPSPVKLIEGCNLSICTDWTTEKLLAVRLCCLSVPIEDDEPTVMNNVNASDYIPANGGFGCKLYARSTCSMIKPLLRCCTSKLVNEYFEYAIKLRERQQQLKSFVPRATRSSAKTIESPFLFPVPGFNSQPQQSSYNNLETILKNRIKNRQILQD